MSSMRLYNESCSRRSPLPPRARKLESPSDLKLLPRDFANRSDGYRHDYFQPSPAKGQSASAIQGTGRTIGQDGNIEILRSPHSRSKSPRTRSSSFSSRTRTRSPSRRYTSHRDSLNVGRDNSETALAIRAPVHLRPKPLNVEQRETNHPSGAIGFTGFCNCQTRCCAPGTECLNSKSVDGTYAKPPVRILAPCEKEVLTRGIGLGHPAKSMSVGALRTEGEAARKKEEHSRTEAIRRKEEGKRREQIAKLLPGVFLVNAEPGNRKKGAANYTKIGVLDGVILFIESLPTDARVKAEEEIKRKVEDIDKKNLRHWLLPGGE